MNVKSLDRHTQALLALHDYGTRDGATVSSILTAMVKDGFTREEIAAASAQMLGDDLPPHRRPTVKE